MPSNKKPRKPDFAKKDPSPTKRSSSFILTAKNGAFAIAALSFLISIWAFASSNNHTPKASDKPVPRPSGSSASTRSSSHASTYTPSESLVAQTDLWQVQDLPGKGKGVVATFDIPVGTLLMIESPLFVIPSQINTQPGETFSPHKYIHEQLSSLSPTSRDAFFALSTSGLTPPSESERSEGPLLDLFETNAISAGNSPVDGVPRTGIFPTVARMNHGCNPSAVYFWRSDLARPEVEAEDGRLAVHTIKPIRAGEEILTTYFDSVRPKEERKAFLRERYGFDCDCEVCRLEGKESEESDRRRRKVQEMRGELRMWGNVESGMGMDRALELTEEIMRTMDEEGYASERGQLAADAAHVASSYKSLDRTRQWASRASHAFATECGVGSYEAKTWALLAEEPWRYGGWGSRTGQV